MMTEQAGDWFAKYMGGAVDRSKSAPGTATAAEAALAVDRARLASARPADMAANPPNPKQRFGDMKPDLSLVPGPALIYAALAMMEGARKYGPYNWRDKAVEAMTYVAAAERHLRAWVDGEELDPDSGNPHLAHAMACLAILIDAKETEGCLIDNRPKAGGTAGLIERWGLVLKARASQAAPADIYATLARTIYDLTR